MTKGKYFRLHPAISKMISRYSEIADCYQNAVVEKALYDFFDRQLVESKYLNDSDINANSDNDWKSFQTFLSEYQEGDVA